MCHRFSQHSPVSRYARLFGIEPHWSEAPHYNVAPASEVIVLRSTAERGRELVHMRWGLLSEGAGGTGMINAHADERLGKNPAFGERRCLVPVDGFFEWQAGESRPYYVRRRDGEPFALAGIWEPAEREGKQVETFSIIVTAANELLRPIGEEMPVIVGPHEYFLWLRPDVHDITRLRPMLLSYPSEELEVVPVSEAVNDVGNDGPELLARVETGEGVRPEAP